MFCGPGTIYFENGGKISFAQCNSLNTTMTFEDEYYGEGSSILNSIKLPSQMEATFSGTAFIIPQEKEKIMNREYIDTIRVKFPNSDKTYDYQMSTDGSDAIYSGEKFRIMNENFYCYSNSLVTCDKHIPEVTNSATKRIIAYYYPDLDYGWVDKEWLKNNKNTISYSTLITKLDNLCDQNAQYVFDIDAIKDIYRPAGLEEKSKDDWISVNTSDNISTGISSLSNHTILTTSMGNSFQELSNRISQVEDAVLSAGAAMKNVTCQTADFVEKNKNNNTLKGEDKMNIFGNFEFGKVIHRNEYKMTLKGLAYSSISGSAEQLKNTYVQYNPATNEFEDVTPFVLDIDVKDFIYKMPVATSAVKAGDIILDMSHPVFVKEVKGSEITVVDPASREVRTLIAAKNAFNFNFVTKIVNLMDNFNLAGSANADNPFGNILPLMMLSGDKSDMKDLLPLMLLGNGGNVDFASNPMMMYFLMKDGQSNDMLPFLLMGNPNFFGAPASTVTTNED
jgi:hypothetical protein